MNIKITYNWLLEYLDTDATPQEIQKYLSLCGAGVERVDKVDDDYVFDIEITSNRVDMASVFGIAQEATAVLPQFGKKAKLKVNPLERYRFSTITENKNLEADIKILDEDIATRVSAIILSDIEIKQSPDIIKKRLEMCDTRSINNVVDISNYLMISLGQPNHTFDYDKIKDQKLYIRLSKKGETVKTLDEKVFTVPGGDIVIEDGSGELTDLAGIMGGYDSMVTENTKNVLLLLETYNKRKIRKTSMLTGQRTVAATYFEKGLDEERIEATLVYGVELLEKYAGGKVASPIYDIYPEPYKEKETTVYLSTINRIIGVDLEPKRVEDILKNLGFGVETTEEEGFAYPDSVKFRVTIPSYRKDDVEIKEDIVEEVARVYGYHNLPNNISPMVHVKQPRDIELLFELQRKVKYFMKHLGLNEVMNYSMISKELIDSLELDENNKLMLANTISEEIKYMRTTLAPSLIKNIKDNQGKRDVLKFFEISRIYEKRENDLPHEQTRLAIATTTNLFDVKGIFEALMRELHIHDFEFKKANLPHYMPNVQAHVYIAGKNAGHIGQLKTVYQQKMEIKENVIILEIDFKTLIDNYKILSPYNSPTQFAVIKLDVTIKQNPEMSFAEIKNKAKEQSQYLTNVEVIDQYKDQLTLRFYFSSSEKNITDDEAKKELEKIQKSL